MRPVQPALNDASIAVVRTDRLGDMVLTLPLCKAIKEEYPGCRLSLIARSYVAPLLENCPVIDTVLYIDKIDGGIGRIFKTNNFDAAFFPRPRFDEAYSAFIGRVPIRVGSAYRLYSFLFNKRIKDHRKHGNYHEAEYNVRMLSALINKKIDARLVKPVVNTDALIKINNMLADNDLSAGKFIILHPGSGGSTRMWPPEAFSALAELFLSRTNYRIVVTGIAAEMEICSNVSSAHESIVNFCGRLELGSMIALISQAGLLVANGTGVLHVAAALETPTVGLFPDIPGIGPSRWRPFSSNSAAITAPAGNESKTFSMNLIEPIVVYDAAARLLEK